MDKADPQDGSDINPRSLTEILDAVRTVGQDQDCVNVGDVVNALGRASTVAMIFLPAIVATTPLSGIPGLSALCGIIILLVSAQALFGRHTLWLPGFVIRREVEGDKLSDGLDKVRKPLMFLDRHTHERLTFLTTGLGAKVLLAFCVLGGMMMPFLELIPFSASAVAACVSLLSVAILTLDGALVVAAGGVGALVAALVIFLI